MKKNLKYIICIFFMFIIITLFNNSNVIEVETEVKGKLGCLSDYGFTYKETKANSAGAGGNRHSWCETKGWDTEWKQGATVHCIVKGNSDVGHVDDIKSITAKLFGSDGKEICSEKLNHTTGKNKEHFEFDFVHKEKTFNGKIELDAIDEDGDHVYAEDGWVKSDFSAPTYKINKFEVNATNNTLDYSIEIYDGDSGMNPSESFITMGKQNASSELMEKGILTRSTSNTLYFEGSVELSKLGAVGNENFYWVTLWGEDEMGNVVNTGYTKYYSYGESTTATSEKIDDREYTVSATEANTTTNKKVVNTDEDDEALGGFGNVVSNSKLECDSGFAEIIDEAWNIILICAPILTILMGTIGFVQALLSSDADGIKKASSDLIKRAVALLLLMLLKVIVSVILNLFGITICF